MEALVGNTIARTRKRKGENPNFGLNRRASPRPYR